MNSNIFWELNEAYQLGVCNRVDEQVLTEDELVGIQEWVEALIEEGYNLDEYTDEELYEAYLEEARGSGPKLTVLPKSREKDIGKHNDWKDKSPDDMEWGERPEAGKKLKRRATAVVGTRRREDKEVGLREELDLYDIISEYLVSEGFCESYEDADVIMANMSEEWRQSILDEEDEKFLKARKKSIARLNAAKNIEDKQADSDYQNSIDLSNNNPSKGKSGYMEVPTDYRARKRRASGR